MVTKLLPAAAVVAAAFASMSHAQGRPPAELPPQGFAGQQYVDSRGCVYIRAGHGGQVNWVSRIDRARKPICGQTPSTAVIAEARRELAAPEAVAPARVAAPAPVRVAGSAARVPTEHYVPPPVTYGKPTPLAGYARATAPVAAVPAPAAAPQRHAEGSGHGHWPRVPGWPSDNNNQINPQGVPAQGGVLTPNVGGHPPLRHRTTGCPADAPHGRIYDLADGRNIMLCATKPHTLRNVSPQQLHRYHGYSQAAGGAAVVIQHAQAGTGTGDLMAPPKGYKQAWQDDRLNPHRGERSAVGRAQMAQVWTDDVPQELQHPALAKPTSARVSSRGKAEGFAGGFVQVGSFAQSGNAARAAARLQALGLPVQISRSASRGKPVQVVQAGPFASAADATAALTAVRRNGFADAILRR